MDAGMRDECNLRRRTTEMAAMRSKMLQSKTSESTMSGLKMSRSKTLGSKTSRLKTSGLKTLGSKMSGSKTSASKMSGLNMSELKTSGSKLSGPKLSGPKLSGSKMSGSKMPGSKLSGSKLSGPKMPGSKLSGPKLSGPKLSGSKTSGSKMSGLKLWGSKTSGLTMSGSKMPGPKMPGPKTSGSKLSGSKTSGPKTSGPKMSGLNLWGSKTSGLTMSGVRWWTAVVFIASWIELIHGTCPGSAPCHCYSHKEDYFLDCREKELERMPRLVKHGYRAEMIAVADISYNRIEYVGENVFYGLRVKVIDLSHNRIRKLSPSAFGGVVLSVEKIDLSWNLLTTETMPFLFFSKLDFLAELNLEGNLFPVLPKAAFTRMKNLKVLRLGSCRISVVDPMAFWGAHVNLANLDLSRNFLFNVPKAALDSLPALEQVSLAGNRIQRLPDYCLPNRRLRVLDLSANIFVDETAISKNSFCGPALEELHLSTSNLVRFPPTPALNCLDTLRLLNISHNPRNSFVRAAFRSFHHLESLDISNTNMTLRRFDPELFAGLEGTLKSIAIRGLSLHRLPLRALRRLKELTKIDAGMNEIQLLDDEFFTGLRVNKIVLDHNKISSILDYTFAHMTGPLSMDLANNSVSDLNFILRCKFREVSLIHNPIVCTCHVQSLVAWGTKFTGARCHSPHHVKGKPVDALHFQNCDNVSSMPTCDWPTDLAPAVRFSVTAVWLQLFLVVVYFKLALPV